MSIMLDYIVCYSLMCADPNERPSCEEALSHPWLNDRRNLERRRLQHFRNQVHETSAVLEDYVDWSRIQHISFAFSLLLIFGSYSAVITYVFNIGKASELNVNELMSHLRDEFDEIYERVYESVDQLMDFLGDFTSSLWDYVTFRN